jgi:plastocyanin
MEVFMEKKKIRLFCRLILSLTICCLIGTAAYGQTVGEKSKAIHKIVYINAERGIDPLSVTVAPGTTVIWINNADYRLQLKFTDQQVSLACAAPVNFSLDENKVFISTGIPLGGVASLCFVQKGEFKYKLIKMDQFGTPSTSERFNGIIKIQ